MNLEQLRQRRAASLLRQIGLARTTIRAQRSDLARILREWRAIAKKVNAAIAKYERSVDDLGLSSLDSLQPTDLVACLKGCVDDEQTTKLEALEAELDSHEGAIRGAGKKRANKRMKQLELLAGPK